MQEVFIWLAILTFFLVAEAVTVQLTTIWFAGGALVAALVAGMGAEEWLQIILFLVVSLILLILAHIGSLRRKSRLLKEAGR